MAIFVLTSLMWKGIKSLTLFHSLGAVGLKQHFVDIKTEMSTPKAFLCAMNSFQGDWIPEEIARSVPSKLSDNLALDKLASCLYYYNNLAVSIFQSHMGDILKYYWIEKNFAEFHNSMLFILLSQLPSSLFEFSSSYNLHNPLSLQLFLLLSY